MTELLITIPGVLMRRLDELSPSADGDVEDTKAWSLYYTPWCIIDSLMHLIITDYSGGSGEVALIHTGPDNKQVELSVRGFGS